MAEQPRDRESGHVEHTRQPAAGPGEPYAERGPSEAAAYQQTGQTRQYDPANVGGRYTGGRHDADEPAGWTILGRRISWGAIFAGVVIAVGVQILLTALGIGTGAAVFDPAQPGDPAAWTLGIGLWWVITGLIALFIGGWVAGHLSSNPDRIDGALHGLATWGLVAIIGLWMAGTAVGVATTGAWQVMATAMETETVEPGYNDNDIELDPEQQRELERQLEEVDEAVAHAGFWGFAAMLLGAAAAGFGGFLATPGNAAGALSTRKYSSRDRDRGRQH